MSDANARHDAAAPPAASPEHDESPSAIQASIWPEDELERRIARHQAAAQSPSTLTPPAPTPTPDPTPTLAAETAPPGWSFGGEGWRFGQGAAWVKPPPSWLTPEILGSQQYGIVDHIMVERALRHPQLRDGPVTPEAFAGFIANQRENWKQQHDAMKVESIRQAFAAWDHGFLEQGGAPREGVIQAKVVDDLQAGGVRGAVGVAEAIGYNLWNGFSLGHLGREDRSVGAYNDAQISAAQRAQERADNVNAASRDVVLLASGAMAGRVLAVAAEGQMAMQAAGVTQGSVTAARVVMAGQAAYSGEVMHEGIENGDPVQAGLGALGAIASAAAASAPVRSLTALPDDVPRATPTQTGGATAKAPSTVTAQQPANPAIQSLTHDEVIADAMRAVQSTSPLEVPAVPSIAIKPPAPGADVASAARAWQGKGNYPGVDDWQDATIAKGTLLVAGSPGHAGFFTSVDSLAASQLDASRLFSAMQVAPRAGMYRPGVTVFEVIEDAQSAVGRAVANTQHGAGGADQVFVPDFAQRTREVASILLHNRQVAR